jgi:hypothetical protein
MTVVMFLIAEVTSQREIIFPEILAIMTGAWIAKRQPWSVNKRRIFLLTCLASILGVGIVKYIHVQLFFQVALCFLIVGICLVSLRTNFIPIISACILPIYLGTDSWIYSVSVSVMALVIIIGQWLMEKYHMRPINHYSSEEFDLKKEFLWWVKLFVIFGIISIIPLKSRNLFFLAPPLIVTFVEFANPTSPLRKRALNVFEILVFASIVGTVFRMMFNLYFDCPLVICAIFACIFLFVAFDYSRIMFPPAGAILLLPMVLRVEDLKFFPIEVSIGAMIIIPLTMFLFPSKTNK